MDRILHLLGQVGNSDSPKGTFAHTNTTADAEIFGYKGLAVHKNYGLVARTNRRTEVLAFLRALSGLATIAIDDGYPHVHLN
jgi:hypothetical protein